MESILTSIKDLLGIDELDEHFDSQIIMHINSVFFTLNQLGVGTTTCFAISDKTKLWSEFLTDGSFEATKSYMYLKVRLLFDPPLSSALIDSIKQSIAEYEWRLQVAADPIPVDPVVVTDPII